MKGRENLRELFISKIEQKCPRCNNPLDILEDVNKSNYTPEIECPQCGLIIIYESRRNRTFGYALLRIILAGMCGYIACDFVHNLLRILL